MDPNGQIFIVLVVVCIVAVLVAFFGYKNLSTVGQALFARRKVQATGEQSV